MKQYFSFQLALLLLIGIGFIHCKSIEIKSSTSDLSVEGFGADGTGNTSSQAAFEAAVNQAIETGRSIFIPPGIYRLTRTITIDKPVKINGAGVMSTGIIFNSTKDSEWIFVFTKGSGLSEIGDLSIANKNGNGIKHEFSKHSILRNIKAGFGLSGIAFFSTESIGLKYLDIEVGTNGQQFFVGHKEVPEIGIKVNSGKRFNSNQLVIERSYVAGCRSHGIFIDGKDHSDTYSLYMMINNTIAEGNRGYGIYINDAQGVRITNSHLESNRLGDLQVSEGHGFSWNGGIIGDCSITETSGALFLSAVIGNLFIDPKSYNCTFIGGAIELSNKEVVRTGKWNDNNFIGIIRNNYAANGEGLAMVANQNLFGQVVSKNGNFERWASAPLRPEYYNAEGGARIERSKNAFLGNYCAKIVASGNSEFEGLSFNVDKVLDGRLPKQDANYRLSVSVWVKRENDKLKDRKPIILGKYNGYYNQWARQETGQFTEPGKWEQISYSLAYTKGLNIMISFPKNAPAGSTIYIDALTVTLGNSVPAIYADSEDDSVIKNRKIEYLNEIPSKGSFIKGDVAYNNDPSPGNYVGWVCVKSGTPGVWKAFGKIEK